MGLLFDVNNTWNLGVGTSNIKTILLFISPIRTVYWIQNQFLCKSPTICNGIRQSSVMVTTIQPPGFKSESGPSFYEARLWHWAYPRLYPSPGNDAKLIRCVLGMTLNSSIDQCPGHDCGHVCAFGRVDETVGWKAPCRKVCGYFVIKADIWLALLSLYFIL